MGPSALWQEWGLFEEETGGLRSAWLASCLMEDSVSPCLKEGRLLTESEDFQL